MTPDALQYSNVTFGSTWKLYTIVFLFAVPKVISSAILRSLTILNRALRAAIDAAQALRAVLFHPDRALAIHANCPDRTDPRAEPASVAILCRIERAGTLGKEIEHGTNRSRFELRARALTNVVCAAS